MFPPVMPARGVRTVESVMTEVGATLAGAVEAHVHAGDSVHVMLGHSRWTAAAREMARQFWGTDPGMTLVMTSLGPPGPRVVARGQGGAGVGA
jgi:hypothetical protein